VTARIVTIEQCNDEDILVCFDTDVLIPAIRDADSDELERLLRTRHALRRYTSTTLYEIAFARKGTDLSRLKANQQWLADHFPDRDRLDDAVAAEFERSLMNYATGLRGKADLGDALLASWCQARSSDRNACAIATINGRDYRALPVALVRDFLPASFVLDD
jgi:predicted nucleic acid-binding protein